MDEKQILKCKKHPRTFLACPICGNKNLKEEGMWTGEYPGDEDGEWTDVLICEKCDEYMSYEEACKLCTREKERAERKARRIFMKDKYLVIVNADKIIFDNKKSIKHKFLEEFKMMVFPKKGKKLRRGDYAVFDHNGYLIKSRTPTDLFILK